MIYGTKKSLKNKKRFLMIVKKMRLELQRQLIQNTSCGKTSAIQELRKKYEDFSVSL